MESSAYPLDIGSYLRRSDSHRASSSARLRVIRSAPSGSSSARLRVIRSAPSGEVCLHCGGVRPVEFVAVREIAVIVHVILFHFRVPFFGLGDVVFFGEILRQQAGALFADDRGKHIVPVGVAAERFDVGFCGRSRYVFHQAHGSSTIVDTFRNLAVEVFVRAFKVGNTFSIVRRPQV